MMMMSKPCRGEMSVIDQGSRLLACARVPFLGTATSTQQREQQGNDRRWSEPAATTTRTRTRSKAGGRHVPSAHGSGVRRRLSTTGPSTSVNGRSVRALARSPSSSTFRSRIPICVYHRRRSASRLCHPGPMQGSPAGSIGVRSRR